MKTSKIFAIVLLFGLSLLIGGCASKKSVAGSTDIPTAPVKDSRVALLQDALDRYTGWTTAMLSGKIHLESLPVSPSVKVYMKKGEELTISASAILVGEVFRAEITRDSLFIVNKLKKVYCKEGGEKLQQIYPTLCEEVQSLLLGRMIVPGSGTLSAANISKVTVDMENEIRKVSPTLGDFPIEVSAYYLLGKDGRLSDLIVDGEAGRRLFSMNYRWKGNGASDITATVKRKNKPMEVEISLDAPKWGASPLSPCKLGKGYKKVGIQEFFKSI